MAITVVEVTKICTGNHYRVVLDVDGEKVEEVVVPNEGRFQVATNFAMSLFSYFAREKGVGVEGMRGKTLADDVPATTTRVR